MADWLISDSEEEDLYGLPVRRNIASGSKQRDIIIISDSENDDDEIPVASSSKRRLSTTAGPSRAILSPPPFGRSAVLEPYDGVPEAREPYAYIPLDADAVVAAVLAIIPNVEVGHLRRLVEQYEPTQGSAAIEHVLHVLFEDPNYPKITGKGKRKREDSSDTCHKQKVTKIDFASLNRQSDGSVNYRVMALEQLRMDFPHLSVTQIHESFVRNNELYAPTYLYIEAEEIPAEPAAEPARGKGKGKVRQDDAFEAELQWINLQRSLRMGENVDEEEESGAGVECGCCFSESPFRKMVQCSDAHLFCQECVTSYASSLLGSHDTNIVCMDQGGCKLAFPESELVRVLEPKLVALYFRVKQRKEIEAAGLEGLEECPFCEYKVVIESPDEKLFQCEGEDCGIISCRGCKKEDHLPKSCKEMEQDKYLNAQHAIEEAMTKALMRSCPQCKQSFVKDYGCNMMKCPGCNCMSCYACRKLVKGYSHFDQMPGQPINKCAQIVPVEHLHAQEVNEAAKMALDAFKADHPDADENDINVQLAEQPPAPVRQPGHRFFPLNRPHLPGHDWAPQWPAPPPQAQYHAPIAPPTHHQQPMFHYPPHLPQWQPGMNWVNPHGWTPPQGGPYAHPGNWTMPPQQWVQPEQAPHDVARAREMERVRELQRQQMLQQQMQDYQERVHQARLRWEMETQRF